MSPGLGGDACAGRILYRKAAVSLPVSLSGGLLPKKPIALTLFVSHVLNCSIK